MEDMASLRTGHHGGHGITVSGMSILHSSCSLEITDLYNYIHRAVLEIGE